MATRQERTAAENTEGQPTDTGREGLTTEEAKRRLEQYGENALTEEEQSLLGRLASYFWGPIPWMIEAAGILAASAQQWADLAIIVTMLLVNAAVAFWQEYKADNAIAALKQRLALKARARRDGKWQDVPARELVPGDIILVSLGNIVPADARLLDGDYLSVDQSALTGESLPVEKHADDDAYSGTIVTQGEMSAEVTATGMKTYFGRTAGLVQTAHRESHFQRAVLRIGNVLIGATLALVALIVVVALFRDDPLVDTLLFALILTVAAIPVALPAVLSVTMAVGAETLAAMKAIVTRLVSIEEMAGMDVLCSDKTGTLTQNRLTLGEVAVLDGESTDEVVIAAALASRSDHTDPIDAAILGSETVQANQSAIAGWNISKFTPFDPVHKRTLADAEHDGKTRHVAKGAPQAIAELTGGDAAFKERLSKKVDELANRGFRTLGVAARDDDGEWRYLGLLPLFDPPREDSAETLETTRNLGVTVKMVTGDHAAIARETASRLGMGTDILGADEAFGDGGSAADPARVERADGFAQVFPEHKFRLVSTLQDRGHIVGMTGDGVNDAPALKQADIGVAVAGATDAARAAADLVLTAPGLSVITGAIEEARRIFERMNSYATYRIAETIRVLLFMTLSILVFNFYPVTAVMIILLALLNDFPIMMIAYDNTAPAPHPVRWRMPRMITVASVLGVVGVVETFLLFWFAETHMGLGREQIQTLIFLKLLVAGHLTIYITRNTGPIWQRPFPSLKLFLTTETTQVVGTLAAVYGWFVTPIGWPLALFVWGYCLAWFLIESGAKILTHRLLDHGAVFQLRHLTRVEHAFHNHHH